MAWSFVLLAPEKLQLLCLNKKMHFPWNKKYSDFEVTVGTVFKMRTGSVLAMTYLTAVAE